MNRTIQLRLKTLHTHTHWAVDKRIVEGKKLKQETKCFALTESAKVLQNMQEGKKLQKYNKQSIVFPCTKLSQEN